ncbi:hypothetical protein D3C72_1633520 [compost metagenome]
MNISETHDQLSHAFNVVRMDLTQKKSLANQLVVRIICDQLLASLLISMNNFEMILEAVIVRNIFHLRVLQQTDHGFFLRLRPQTFTTNKATHC